VETRSFAFKWLTAGLLALSLIIVGCNKKEDPNLLETNSAATLDDQEDAAEDFAATIADPNEGMIGFWSSSPAEMAPLKGIKDEEAVTADTSTFLRGDSLTFKVIKIFYDAMGAASQTYDSVTTVRMTREVKITGSVTHAWRSVKVNQQGMESITGIARGDTIRTFIGEGQRTLVGYFNTNLRQDSSRVVRRSVDLLHEWTIDTVRVNSDHRIYPYPLNGSVSLHSTMHRTFDTPNGPALTIVEVYAKVTFNGTRYAKINVTDGKEYWIDLMVGRLYKTRP
jgi:hypothetical protein